MNEVRVLIADDHNIVRAGISSLLKAIPYVKVVAEASNGREVIELAKANQPDLVLMDIGMPDLNGLEATLRLKKERPDLRIIILSMHSNEEYIVQAIKAGASGYLVKKCAISDLKSAIDAVMKGETWICTEVGKRIERAGIQIKNSQVKSPMELLTPRQREILQYISERKNTKEIASLLNLSPKTVEFHRAELMSRLGIFDVPGLVRYAIQNTITPPEN